MRAGKTKTAPEPPREAFPGIKMRSKYLIYKRKRMADRTGLELVGVRFAVVHCVAKLMILKDFLSQ